MHCGPLLPIGVPLVLIFIILVAGNEASRSVFRSRRGESRSTSPTTGGAGGNVNGGTSLTASLEALSATLGAGLGGGFGAGRNNNPRLPVSPEAYMTSPQIILYRGYPVEVHEVVTEDGYVLGIHRIPYGRTPVSQLKRPKRPVFLQHGLFDSDADWLINPTDRALAFILADRGYDVWLGNARGNAYSKKHLTLDVNDEAFWDFSWDEIGYYDIPACINYILKVTRRERLVYIGHSMGTAVFWVAMITHPELNSKIDLMVGLAPAASVANTKSLLRHTAAYVNSIESFLRLIRTKAFLPNSGIPRRVREVLCERTLREATLCRNFIFLVAGADPHNFNISALPVISGHNPSGTSVRTVFQFARSYNLGQKFTKYDYGPQGNLEHYGQVEAPEYNLNLVRAPVYLFWGENDLMTTPEDVAWLASKLPNLQASIRVDYPYFNHWDFLWSVNINELLYNRLVGLLPPPFYNPITEPRPPTLQQAPVVQGKPIPAPQTNITRRFAMGTTG